MPCAARPAAIACKCSTRTASRRLLDVTVGLIANGSAEIQSGLTEGESVVTGTVAAARDHATGAGGLGSPASVARRSAAELTGATGRRGRGLPAGPSRERFAHHSSPGSAGCTSRAGSTSRRSTASTSTVDAGEFVAIVGPSGSGKSTLMNILGCLDRPTAGRYVLDGTSVAELDDDASPGSAAARSASSSSRSTCCRARPRSRTSRCRCLPGRRPQGAPARAIAALERLGLGDRLDHEPTELSGGQQQRVAIARALVTEPALILADEPTGNLDTPAGAEVIGLLHELHASGRTIVLITHDADVAASAERQVHVRDGRIVA